MFWKKKQDKSRQSFSNRYNVTNNKFCVTKIDIVNRKEKFFKLICYKIIFIACVSFFFIGYYYYYYYYY